MKLEWLEKENPANKVAILTAIAGILFFIVSLTIVMLFFLIELWRPELTRPILALFAIWRLLGVCVYLLGFAGLICGVIGLVKNFKAKKKPSKIAGLAMAVNLVIALLLLGIPIARLFQGT
ncbi:MAG: hypothetical protein NT067_01205 [Candidatus Diapherotrites archaeon]|nr:hypothetical protein [Candidatus Diapherotrites archaeon]